MKRNNSFREDIVKKRVSFIGRVQSILQEIPFVNPVVNMDPLYGTMDKCDRLYSAWNNAVVFPELLIDTLWSI